MSAISERLIALAAEVKDLEAQNGNLFEALLEANEIKVRLTEELRQLKEPMNSDLEVSPDLRSAESTKFP